MPRIFDPRRVGDYTFEVFRRALFRELASGMDGYAELIDAGTRLEAFAPSFVATDDSPFETAARAVLDGADPDEQVRAVAAHLAEVNLRRDVVHEIVVRAEGELDARADVWVNKHLRAAAEALGERLQGIVDQARDVVADLASVRTTEDLAGHPEAAPAWAAFWAIVPDFEAAFDPGQTMARAGGRDEHWHEVWLIDNYREVWPGYFLRDGMDVQDHNGRTFRTVEPIREPWLHLSKAELLRFLVESKANVTVDLNVAGRVAELEQHAVDDQRAFEASEAREHADAMVPNSGPVRPIVVHANS